MIQVENEGNNDNEEINNNNEEELQQDTKEPIVDNTQKNNENNEQNEIKENVEQHNEEEKENENDNNKQPDNNNEEVINEQKEEKVENDNNNNNDLNNINNVNDNKPEIEQEKQNENTIPINEEQQQQEQPQTEHEIEHTEQQQQQIDNQLNDNDDNNSSPNQQHINTCTLTDQAVQTIPIVNPLFKSTSKLQLTSQYRIKPKFHKLLNQVITTSFDPILNYLDLYDLCNLRIINKMYLALIHDYYQRRLKLEISFITQYQEENKEKTLMFMKSIDSQIPISNNNWLDFNLSSVTSKLQLLDRNLTF